MNRFRAVHIVLLSLVLSFVMPGVALAQSLGFDGVSGSVRIAHSEALNISESGTWSQGSIMAYIKLNDPTEDEFLRIVSKKISWDDYYGYELEVNPAQGWITLLAGGDDFARGSFSASTNWTQIVASFNGSSASIYVNGVDVTTDSTIGNIYGSTVGLNIGSISNGPDENPSVFNGKIDDVAIWNQEQSPYGVSEIYNSGNALNVTTLSSSSNSLVGYWRMNEGSGSLVYDSKNDYDGNIYGNVTWSSDAPQQQLLPDYKWFSSDSAGGPVYSWQDITSTGTLISMSGDDNNTGPHPIGFVFPFYGIDYSTFRISTNGFISFTSSSSAYNNLEFPTTGNAPEAALAPFWDDLIFTSDKAYYYSDETQLVITFNDVDRLGQEATSSYTFQVILKSTGEIIFQYNIMNGPLNGATIGWQNQDRTEGTNIVYNNRNFNLIQNGWALRIEDINSGLPPPSSFSSAASYQTVDLSWIASSSDSVANYVIYRGTSSSSLSLLDSVASTVTSYSNTSLTNGTTYYFGIRSKSSSGDYSVMRTTSATPNVASPTNLSATVTTGQVTLSWAAAIGSSIAHTLIYQGTSSSNLLLVDSTSNASTETKTITGLTNNTTYYFYVQSRGTDGSVSSTTSQVEATPTYTGPVWWVSSSVNSDGDGTQASPFRYISSAITAAAEDDTVKLVAGTYTGANNRGLDTDKNLVFISASGAESTALDAGTYDRHFYFNDGQDSTFQVIGLTLKNGKKSNDNGGSVYIQNSSPIFKNCIFEENESGYSGGAIRIFEGSPEFRNCIFRNNSSGSQGGAIQITGTYNSGVAFRPVFKNCVFTSNSITVTGAFGNASGAAVYFDGTGSVEFSDCQFRYNSITSSGSGYGGAININGNYNNDDQVENPVLLNRCSFIGNSVSGQNNTYGAALKINSSTHIINCLIADNTMHGNQAGSGYWSPGAGIFIQLNSYWDSDEQAEENGTVKIINSTIVNNDNNSSGQQSGGLHISNSTDNLTMFNTILWGNTHEYNSGNPNINDQGTLLTDYNNIENGDTWSNLGSNSIYIDPQFSDATNGDYSLGIASSLVAAGVATFEGISAPTVDIRNNSTSYPRPNPSGSSPDLGAYESSYSSSPYPDAPTGLTATAGDGTITLSWTASSETDIAKYGVYYGTESGPTVKQAEVSGASTVTTTISGLSNNVPYYFRITAIDSDSYESGYSSEVSASPAFSGSTIYVDNSGSEPSNPDGSESNAFYSIQDAIDAESTINGKRILVKAGTYTGSGSNPVIDLKGKNVIIESDAGPATTIIDAGGSRTALSLDKYDGQFSGYSASATKFIGLTFTNGDDDESLIDINGPNMNESNGPNMNESTNSWDITFENCRFTNTDNDYGSGYSVVYVARSNSIFDGCEFRDLNIIGNFQNTSEKSAPIKIQGENNWYYDSNTGQNIQDTTVYRPQFKNCVIADNSVVNTGSNKNYYDNYRGGGITVKVGAIPYFENTRIDSNTVDAGGDYPANFYAHINGGGVYIEGRYENDPPIKFVNCSISGNVAKGTNVNGGGVYTQAAQTQFINTVITNNLAYGAYDNDNHYVDVKGGGIYCSPNSNINNENPNYSSKEPLVLLVNCTVANNKLKYIAASSINWAGAGIRRASYIDPVQIMNSIVYHNTVVGEESSSGAHKINMSQGNSGWGSQESTIGYSFIEHYDDAQIEGDEIYDYPPAFNDTANGDFSLSIASLAIGAGVSEYEDVDAAAYDYNNSARPNPAGSNPDLGAFENSLSSSPYPAKPQSLTVSSTGDSTGVLSWAESSESDLIRYRVYYGTSSPAATLIDSASASATSISIGGLTNGTTYYFRITALDGDGYESIYSAEVSGVPEYNGPVWYVDDNSGSGSREGSPGDPFREIQDAIDVASTGDTVKVLPGTYDRSDDQELTFYDSENNTAKNIVLMSRDGAATTFLDGENKLVFDISDHTDTTLHIIGFTITASNGGEDQGSGAVVKIHGGSFWNNNTQQNEYVVSGATFKHCVFTMYESDEDWSEVAVDINQSNVVFDNCEFKNISVDYTNYQNGDAFAAAIRAGSPYGSSSQLGSTVLLRRSKIINNKIQRTDEGYIHAGAIMVGPSSSNNVKIMNTIIADNEVYYSVNFSSGYQTSGGAIKSRGGHIQIINSTIVNNELKTDEYSTGGGSAINVEDWSNDGDQPYLTIFNSIIYGNVTTTNGGSNFQDQIIINDYSDGAEAYFSYSVIQGDDDFGGEEILNLDPEFLDNTYALHPRSPAIGAGAVESEDAEGNIIYAPTVDITGSSRPNPSDDDSYPGRDAVPDLGAMESELAVTPYPDSPTDLFVVENHQSVQLFWNPSNAGDVVKYKIYSSSDSITFTLSDSVSGRYNTEGSVGGLTNEDYYWFYVTSLDSNDYESSASLQVKAKPHYQGPVWYVDMNSGSGSHEGSATDAFRDIQDGIDAADEGDTVMVLPGTYDRPDDQELEFIHDENSTILPKNIVLFARDGPDSTIIDGEGNKHLFVIDTRNDTTLKIVGFTIQNGGGDFGGAAITVSGVYVGETNGTINFDPTGAVFENCIIKDADNNGIPAINVGYGGAAIFRDCLIKNNRNYTTGGQVDGAGIKVSQQGIVVLDRTKVMENYTDNTGAGSENHRGPGVHVDNSAIYVINSLIAGNYSIEDHQGSANYGSGLYAWHSDVVIFNSTITDNQGIDNPGSGSGTAVEIGGDNVGQIVIFNSIITGNSPSNMQTYIQQNSGQYVAISNSIFEEGSSEWFFDDSEGCYDFDPLFEDSLGTLSVYSPAIGKGGTSIEDVDGNDIPSPSVDLYGNPRPSPAGSRSDIGAYEHILSEPKRLVFYVDDSNGSDNNDGLTMETALKTIGEGLNKSSNRDTLELVAGTYSGLDNRNLNMQGLTRIIRSVSGSATTIIDCENQGPAFVFNNDESDSVHISGLTIINGSNNNGGAVSISGADPVFEDMIFKDNNSSGNGGAVYANNSQSSFTNSVFLDNHASSGAAVYSSGGDISLSHCTLLENFGDDESGIKNTSGDFILMNSIYWGNDNIAGDVDVLYTNIMGGHDGPGNINSRPGFTDAENGDLSLLSWSPMIGRGNAANIIISDILGTSRADSVAPDLGAYENSLDSPSAYSPVNWYVDTTGTDEVIYSNPSASTGSFKSIDWVMDHVLEGDSVIIHPGYYDNGFNNWGKSVHLRGSSSSPDDVWISEEMEFNGGSSSLHMLSVHNDEGNGIIVAGGSIDISYVLIDSVSGKAIAISDTADASISNITLYGNGHAFVDSSSGTVTVVNSIIWGNTNAVAGDPDITYSNVQGGYAGAGNISVDPLFSNAAEKDFELSILSPCIDTGDTSSTYDADNTVIDMGAFPRQRVLLSGASTGDINVSADTVVIITDDFTVAEDDTLELEAGAELYFGPGASLTVSGALDADGDQDGGAISFLPTHPDSTWGGLTISGESGDGHGGRSNHNSYSYIQISGVEAAAIPLTVEGSAVLNHVTIAGNANPVSLSTSGTVDLNYSILEGQVEGTVNSVASFTSSTDQFSDYANDDFTLLAAASGIDVDTTKVDPDYTYGDAGAYYHNQSSYPVTSITVLRPAAGDTLLASPDTSTTVGLTSNIQLFNTYGRYKTKGSVTWASVNNTGSFSIVSTDSTNLNGIISNQYVTSAVTGSYNSFTVSADDASSTSGFYLVEPGVPDSVVVAVQSVTMTQLDSLTFTANVYDQFSNLVRLGENVVWSFNSVSGTGEGYRLSSDTTATDASGNTTVILFTDPTDNTLIVGDQVTVTATSGLGSHISSIVSIIPSDIYNLTLHEDQTADELGVSADTAYIDFYTALVDTFDNPLENVEVFWEVVTGSGTGEGLSASSSNTNATGVANTRLNTNTLAGSEYQVRCWVTESSLLHAFGSFQDLADNNLSSSPTSTGASGGLNLSSIGSISNLVKRGVSNESISFAREEESLNRPSRFVPIQIGSPSTLDRSISRDAVYDLDDTSAVVLVWPGATFSLSGVAPEGEDVELDEQFGFTLDAHDQFGNLVRDNTPVTWLISPASSNVSILSQDDGTTNGQASIGLQVSSEAVWDFSFIIIATVEGVSDSTGSYRIDDITAPASVSALSISPSVWTSTNDFTLNWTNPSEHSGIAGAHYEINGESSEYVSGSEIQTLNFTMPTNSSRTVKLWLQDNAGNDDAANAITVTAKWDDTSPQAFNLSQPLTGWYNATEYRFEWNASSDATSGLNHYIWSLDESGGSGSAESITISPDSTGYSFPNTLSNGVYEWKVTAYDSAGNEMETSNPQTISIDHTPPGITHNPVLEATENTAVVINAVFTEDGAGQSGISKAELYYRRGGESNWQPPVDMSTLSSYQIASSYSTSSGIEYYLYAQDVAGNMTNKPVVDFTSISVTIPNGLASTDRWPTGVPNGTDVGSYQLWSYPGNPASTSPVNLIVDDMPEGAFDNTKWRAFAYAGSGAWTEFEQLSSLNNGESYFILIKDPGFSINTGQTYTITTNQPYEISLTSGDWTFIGNPFDFSIPLTSVRTEDSTSLSGDPNFYTYDGGSWTNASSIAPWGGYIYKSSTATKIFIDPGVGSGGLLGRKVADSDIIFEDNEWLINISARNGLGRDKFNEVGLLQGAMDMYDSYDAFEPPLVPGGVSVRVDNRNWPENGDTYTRDIRMPKDDGEYWDLEIIAQDDEHNVYLTFEDLDLIPEDLDVFAIDITLGVAQDLRWRHVYKYAVTNPSQKHEVRFIAGSREFLQKNNAGIELFPDRYALSQNYPNPFNPQTSILLTMQDEARISLVVYNLLGEEVAVLANNEYRPAGYHNFIWKGLNKDKERVASGVYFYMAQVISPQGKLLISDTHKMILVK